MSAGGNERIRAKLLKLLALARQGVGGEKANAEAMLGKLLAKHGLSIEDLDDAKAPRDTCWFRPVGKEERTLLANCVATVIGRARANESWRMKSARTLVGYDLTGAEFAQVELVFEIHRRAFRKHLQQQRRAALLAYLSKNDIFPADDDDAPAQPSTLSPEDVQAIVAMIAGMRPTAVHKAITGPGGAR
jgi:hypothetical protein